MSEEASGRPDCIRFANYCTGDAVVLRKGQKGLNSPSCNQPCLILLLSEARLTHEVVGRTMELQGWYIRHQSYRHLFFLLDCTAGISSHIGCKNDGREKRVSAGPPSPLSASYVATRVVKEMC